MRDFPDNIFAGRRYAVVGLGRAGLASMRALSAMGAAVVGWDDAAATRDAARQEGWDIADPTSDISNFDALLLSPGIPHLLPLAHPIAYAARACGVPILTDAELLFQAVRRADGRARFAGITGTNGKSTTTALLAHILTAAHVPNVAGANLGRAALSLPFLPDDGVYVLEMSSYMLERLATLRFNAACMLNLSPDHLDRHGDMAGYATAKQQIFARQQNGDAAIIGRDDEYARAMADNLPHAIRISAIEHADIYALGRQLRSRDRRIEFDLREASALPGQHNAQNAAAATAMALALGIDTTAIYAGLRSFPGLAHRQELVGEIDGVRFINDSKATNADATSRALSCYERVIWIAGGIAKAGGIAPLAHLFPRVAEAILIGRDAALFAETFAENKVAFDIADTLDKAVALAFARAKALGVGVILLSPACASFDQFSGFEERGAYFGELVRKLALREVL